MRCFIALDLPRGIINEIKRIQQLIKKKKLFDGKLTESENLHLTLKFLGEISEDKVEKVKEGLRKIKFENFEAELGEIGAFPMKYKKKVRGKDKKYKNYIRVIWVKLGGKGVFELQKQVDEILKDLFKPEVRFMSHITIARVKRVYDKTGFLEYLNKLKIPKLRFKVKKFYLKKSELFESGPIYEDVEEYVLE